MRLIDILLNLPKTLFINLKYLPFNQAIKLPIIASYRTKAFGKGKILIRGKVKSGMIKIGLTGSGTAKYYPCVIENNGVVELKGRTFFGGGCQLSVSENGLLTIGSETRFMGQCHIVSLKKIEIGEACAISWNTQIMDTDFHTIIFNDKIVNQDDNVNIGNHVWIASNVIINKGSIIPDNCVIASNSLINNKYFKENSLIGGIPGKELRQGIEWKI